ncbi:Conserved hypothetical protein [Prochlorococcus marinus str. MIT 9312]|uniref:Uncharacterized protein n=1 Tax=Prochlorococcus marinus (strain MIT 9312) TaxID=74546 RepID=A7FAC9_PROM9|nr:Conserved hypothetical protein [Prochlorococcus marinus str. MIT 9312]
MINNCQIKIKLNTHMNFEAGIRFIFFLVLFGVTNYLMMLKRYEKDIKKRKVLQYKRISKLYPKGSFIFKN